MSMSHSMGQRQELTQVQEAVMLQKHTLSLRLQLLELIRGFRYQPAGQCPICSRQLTPLEVITGFNDDPHDFTTLCTGCGNRFEAKLMHSSASGSLELPFYCSTQALHQLRELRAIDPDVMKKEHPAIYHSVIVHHGTLRNAFSKIGISYHFDEVVDWKTKVIPFLGRLPDTVIADIVSVSAREVGTLRKKHGIARCTKESMLEEVWDVDH